MSHLQRMLPLLGSLIIALASPVSTKDPTPPRLVFIGDSITDGNTYPLLIHQALADAGQPVPICLNAGVAGDTAAGMRKRLKRDVLARRPTLVLLSAGVNDALHDVKVADYESDVVAILVTLKEEQIPALLLTTTILGPKHAEAEKRLIEYNLVLHRLAAGHGCKVAEVFQQMQAARSAGQELLEEDQVHLSQAGYRVMTRAVLDALGHKDVTVPKELKLAMLPGVVKQWQLRAVDDKEPALDEKSVLNLKPDKTWTGYYLPEEKALTHWWRDQERQRGFALSLKELVGPGKSYLGVASLNSEKAHTVYFNTGAQLQSIWLNGKRIYHSEGWTGWHAGKEQVAAELQAGRNSIVIESGAEFFLSVTNEDDAGGETTKSPKHLLAAQELVDNVKLDDTSYRHGEPSVLWKGSGSATLYESHTDCSGFIDALLSHSYNYDKAALKKWLGKSRPTADCYHDRIAGETGFTLIAKLQDVRPGDILAVKYLTRKGDTGHVMLVAGPPRKMESKKPLIDGTDQWVISIIDSSESGHGLTDTRHGKGKDGKDHAGLGQGVLRIYTRPDGTLAGFSWSTLSVSKFLDPADEHLVIGRLKPGYQP
jgi:lysophospholipase L1-like esterase